MKEVMLKMLPLLIGAAISPVATVGMIAVLTSKKSPRLKGLVYLLGTSLPLFVIGIISIFFFTNLSLAPKNTNISSIIDLVAGLLLLALAIKNFITHKKPSKKSHTNVNVGYLATLLLGSGLMITNFSTIVLFIPAIKEVAISSLIRIEKIELLFVAVGITLAMIALPLIIAAILPKRSESLLKSLRAFMLRHNKEIIQAMLLVFGVYLLVKGIGWLPS